ncbi:LOW QUALITY PROTEIN: hypothetical protein Nmel_005569 [Mimus melanotis]
MQLIHVINADVLAPYHIMHLATILFQPVQYSVFQNTWRQLAEQKALENIQLPQQDSRHAVGVDALLGTGPFTNLDSQARWDPLVLAQAQQIGLNALIKTMEMADLKQRYVTIQQGNKESFLQFVEKVAAAIEKQVDDEKVNENEDCRKINEALPEDPSLVDIVTACSKVGTVEHKMSALAAVLKRSLKCFNCGQQGHLKAQCKQNDEQKITIKTNPGNNFNFNHCGRPGHYVKQCKSKYHTSGQRLQDNEQKNVKGYVGIQILQQPQALLALQSHPFYSGATSGSTGIDIPTANTVTILAKQICKVPLNAYDPIGQRLSAFFRRSSSTIKGIHVHLEIIDDYSGQINAMVSVSEPPVTIQKGIFIAQLVPFVSCLPNAMNQSLGTGVTNTQIVPQPVKLGIEVKTVTDVPKLVGSIGWITPYLRITNHQMQPLFELLSQITSSTDERQLTTPAKKAIEEVELALTHKFVNRIDTSVDVQLFTLKDHEIPCGILCQWNDEWEGKLHILEWIFLSFRYRKTAPGLYELFADIIIKGQITYNLPSHPILTLTKDIPFEGKQICSSVPVEGITVFTDGSGKTGKPAVA